MFFWPSHVHPESKSMTNLFSLFANSADRRPLGFPPHVRGGRCMSSDGGASPLGADARWRCSLSIRCESQARTRYRETRDRCKLAMQILQLGVSILSKKE